MTHLYSSNNIWSTLYFDLSTWNTYYKVRANVFLFFVYLLSFFSSFTKKIFHLLIFLENTSSSSIFVSFLVNIKLRVFTYSIISVVRQICNSTKPLLILKTSIYLSCVRPFTIHYYQILTSSHFSQEYRFWLIRIESSEQLSMQIV